MQDEEVSSIQDGGDDLGGEAERLQDSLPVLHFQTVKHGLPIAFSAHHVLPAQMPKPRTASFQSTVTPSTSVLFRSFLLEPMGRNVAFFL